MKLEYNPKVIEHRGDVVAIDLETNGLNPLYNSILAISICTRYNHYVLDTSIYNSTEIYNILQYIYSYNTVIAHNAKFDASFLYVHYGLDLVNWHCTMLGNQILFNGKDMPNGLVDVLKECLNVTHSESNDKKLMQQSFIGLKQGARLTQRQLDYAAEDTKHLIELYEWQVTKASRFALERIFQLENRLLPVIVKMEVKGCKIDSETWKKVAHSWEEKREEAIRKLDEELENVAPKYPILQQKFYVGKRNKIKIEQFNLFGGVDVEVVEPRNRIQYSSSAQVIELFNDLGLDVPVNKYEDESVDENSLKTYVTENPESPLIRFVELLLEFREIDKLISTYGESFLERLDDNSFIHTQYTQCHTKTGRLASRNPNLQNIPSKGIGKELRQFFQAREGYKLITLDMSSAEVRIAADYSKEQLLIDSLLEGTDMHSKLGSISYSIIFGEPVTITKSTEPITIRGHEFIPDDLRTAHKNVLFAKFYKAGATRIYQQLSRYVNLFHQPKDRLVVCTEISKALDAEMPKLTKYLTAIIDKAQRYGFLRGSKLGRIRYFEDTVYGEAANFPIQETNASAMKIALIRADKYFMANGWGRPVMTIHDELVCEVKDEHVEQAKEDLIKIMTEALQWFLEVVPGGSSAKVGQYWMK